MDIVRLLLSRWYSLEEFLCRSGGKTDLQDSLYRFRPFVKFGGSHENWRVSLLITMMTKFSGGMGAVEEIVKVSGYIMHGYSHVYISVGGGGHNLTGGRLKLLVAAS